LTIYTLAGLSVGQSGGPSASVNRVQGHGVIRHNRSASPCCMLFSFRRAVQSICFGSPGNFSRIFFRPDVLISRRGSLRYEMHSMTGTTVGFDYYRRNWTQKLTIKN